MTRIQHNDADTQTQVERSKDQTVTLPPSVSFNSIGGVEADNNGDVDDVQA
jgi:hypothetical protein